MCLICTSFKENKLTIMEAWGNYSEMADGMDPEHAREVYTMLVKSLSVFRKDKLSPPNIEKIEGKQND